MVAGLPGHTEADRIAPPPPVVLLASAEGAQIWVRVRFDVTLDQLAQSLELSSERLAQLNDTETNHRFSSNDWVALPQRAQENLRLVAALDESDLRRSAPSRASLARDAAVARVGDNLAKIAARYELPLAELVRLNPGMNPLAKLAVDTPVRLLQPARARMTLAILPGGSGGLSWPQLPDFGAPQPSQRNYGSFLRPAAGPLTSGYGWRWGRMHKGIDIANSVGTPIVAVADGVVISSGWNDGGYGYLVELSHRDGTVTRYAHSSRLLVSKGMTVAQGTPLALMGSTGHSTGPHLHFEIHPPGSGAVNPMPFLSAKG
ncbi:MAG: LysM peptidoglycan-binding domain-containing M23 family metallopeptidase [Synechococcus lacustris]